MLVSVLSAKIRTTKVDMGIVSFISVNFSASKYQAVLRVNMQFMWFG